MFGTKIRSWMEAHIVRPRKKQHRGNKDGMKKRHENGNVDLCTEKANELKSSELPCLPETSTKKCQKESTKVEDYVQSNVNLADSNKMVTLRGQNRSRVHNNNNLSSPESAYSTGYSTDGTSPGASFPATTAPPEYYINIRTGIRYFHSTTTEATNTMVVPEPKLPWEPNPEPVSLPVTTKMTSPAMNSPRQRNRIRTNPWVPETIRNNCKCSPIHSRLTPDYIGNNVRSFRNGNKYHVINTSSPVRKKWTYTEKKQHCSRFSSSSSSSTSSISSVHAARVQQKASSEDEDDRTLNEMMGKYDESYVYEKETDILSDSDPTDCDEDYNDSDAEDGREGGDERDLLDDDEDFDFIDNGSLELNILDDDYINKGHCTYHVLGEASVPLRDSSRASRRNASTPTNLRCRRSSERRIRRTSSKKKRERYLESHVAEFNRLQLRTKIPAILDGPRSAGNTPVCIRRRRVLNEYHENRFEKRCNSVSNGPLLRRPGHHKTSDFNVSFNERDKEADKKYKELIIEAEHILMSMRTFRPPITSSPKRAALANKRVELIKNSECGAEIKPPCGAPDIYGSFKEKLSPKKNHITNFINHNSPVMLRRDLEKDNNKQVSPLAIRKERSYEIKNPIVTFKSAELSRLNDSNSCPQSEPVKRKIYGNGSLNADLQMLNADPGKIDRSSNKSVRIVSDVKFKDEEEFQQQKLFHTLSSLKRNLENHSEALKQSYGSSHILSGGSQW